jgi:hypothetical protein
MLPLIIHKQKPAMKNKKLNLNSLKVTSFVTSLEKNKQETLKGGVTENCGASFNACPTVPVNGCAVASYNQACPTIPVAECNPNSDIPEICFAIVATARLINC